MKIIKIKQKKNNLYEIILSDNTSLSFYDDTIIKYNLLVGTNIESKELKDIILSNNTNEAYYKSINYISKKLRTEKEIVNYLTKYNFNKNIIVETINRLKNEKYINNELYIKSYINDQINLTLKGPLKIKKELEKLGFNSIDIDNYLNTFNKELWLDKINHIINKKVKANHNLSNKALLNKLKQDLIKQGFFIIDINNQLNNIDLFDNPDVLKKEFNKVYIKYCKKYSDYELYYRVKMNLLQKGFDSYKIEELIENKKNGSN